MTEYFGASSYPPTTGRYWNWYHQLSAYNWTLLKLGPPVIRLRLDATETGASSYLLSTGRYYRRMIVSSSWNCCFFNERSCLAQRNPSGKLQDIPLLISKKHPGLYNYQNRFHVGNLCGLPAIDNAIGN